MNSAAACAAVGLLLVGCGGGAPGPGGGGAGGGGSGSNAAATVLSGTLAGKAMSPVELISTVIPLNGGGTAGAFAITQTTGFCAKVGTNQVVKNAVTLIVLLVDVSAGGVASAPSGPGEFPILRDAARQPRGDGASPFANVPAGKHAVALYNTNDSVCTTSANVNATGGTVTLTAADASGVYAGQLSLEFGSERVTGTFAGTGCPALATGGTGTVSCN